MKNLVKAIIESVVSSYYERAGCCDEHEEYLAKLNELLDRWEKEGKKDDFDRLVKALGDLARYGVNLEDI